MRNFCKLKAIIYILLLSALWGNALYAKPGKLTNNWNSVSADEKVTGEKDASAKSLAYQQMHLGLFIHYTFAGKPYQWGSTLWADTSKVKSLDELADNFDAENFADMAQSICVQYIIFTIPHANMNVLFPSEVMKKYLPGHWSKRDVLLDLI